MDMKLEERIGNLSLFTQIELALKLIKIGLPIWNKFTTSNKLEYIDTVVGLQHKIDPKIIEKVITLSNKTNNNGLKSQAIFDLQQDFLEPITALQDSDWEIPEEPKLVCYAAYNLLNTLSGQKSTIYTSINQSIDAITISKILTFKEIETLINS